ncbi:MULTISPECIES: hypothetical protein [unclassified Streptomyces]|uniref:hypothetical protein n=1 Tax=unclassified Streptomyces TaxID=2593676 RepID=UPI000DC79FFF|nr:MULTISPECIES: hypothetical protein [unclassified Streptomyces]AWZ04930.1 hypothetical protein DRB89_10015 [Streptomyces sp. ICC4]AWZ13378.1 hypothetical protein DRB96_14830 [Streptomyces sp. ICC1]
MWNHVVTAQQPQKPAWSGIAPGAETVGGAQLYCAVLYWQLTGMSEEPYGRGFGHGIAVLFWLAVMVVGSPLVVVLLGNLHSILFTTPVMELSNAAGVRSKYPAPWWALPVLGALAAVYAAPVALLNDSSYAATWLWLAAYGLLPVGVAVFARMRQVPRAKVRKWAVLPAVAGAIAAFYLGAVAPAYQPPVLERADYIGEWAGDGIRLELGAQGEVVAKRLPVSTWTPGEGTEVVTVCSGNGTWTPQEEDRLQRAGVVLEMPDCTARGTELRWDVAGTAREPELFVLIGDPDAGDLRVLHKK